ncbi:MAG TPA: SRPBCC family protein [Acidimicrobiales bacterium]
MELTNRFRVPVPVDGAWALLTDIERIAPCLPGAQLTEIEGEEYRGVVKVKVGPITAQYKGAAHFVERDEAAHRAVLRAEGRETRGQGNAAATITAQLTPDGDGTEVAVVTDLTVTGKVAQFGRGVLADVSTKLLGQFASSLEAEIAGSGNGSGAATAGTTTAAASSNGVAGAGTATATATATDVGSAGEERSNVRRISSPEPEPVDLLDAAGGSVVRRFGPVVVAVVAAWLLLRLLRRR